MAADPDGIDRSFDRLFLSWEIDDRLDFHTEQLDELWRGQHDLERALDKVLALLVVTIGLGLWGFVVLYGMAA